MESVWRDIDINRIDRHGVSNFNLVIVSHGLTTRTLLMKWFKCTVEQFERLNNPTNREVRIMQLDTGGEYSLLPHHTEEELKRWGLSQEMIADQKWRSSARRGDWNDDCITSAISLITSKSLTRIRDWRKTNKTIYA